MAKVFDFVVPTEAHRASRSHLVVDDLSPSVGLHGVALHQPHILVESEHMAESAWDVGSVCPRAIGRVVHLQCLSAISYQLRCGNFVLGCPRPTESVVVRASRNNLVPVELLQRWQGRHIILEGFGKIPAQRLRTGTESIALKAHFRPIIHDLAHRRGCASRVAILIAK